MASINPASPTASPKRKRESQSTSTTFSSTSSPLRHRTSIFSAASNTASSSSRLPPSRTTPKKSRQAQAAQPRPSTPDSPRTLVATKFEDLDIASNSSNGVGIGPLKLGLSHRPKHVSSLADAQSIPQLDGSGDVTMYDGSNDMKESGVRKKVRTSLKGVKEIPETPQASFYAESLRDDERGVDMDVSRSEAFLETPVRNGRAVVFRGNVVDRDEVKETPHAKRPGLGAPPVGFVKKHSVFPVEDAFMSAAPPLSPPIKSSVAVAHSSSPASSSQANQDADAPMSPPPKATVIANNSNSQASSSQPQDTDVPMSPEEESLHWSDSEITGHDPSDSEDDGEGINGIGFRPTPAIARSRAERRRRQLAEYKSREDKEAREARAKRIAARRRGEDASGSNEREGSEEERRRVRFAEKERAVDVL